MLQPSHQGCILWFTGLSGAGKSTLANYLMDYFRSRDFKVELLDGDEVRENLSKGLGFTKADRDTNIRRIGYVCNLLGRNGVITISAAISPYRDVREELKHSTKNFIEVYINCPVEECIRRDVKGLYKKALAGEITNFTGVSDPYEPPVNPDIVVNTAEETLEESAAKVLAYLREKAFIVDQPQPISMRQVYPGV